MPLPFSFSTQRQNPEGENPMESLAAAAPEKLMNQAPGFISTEPLPGTAGNPFPLPAAPRPIPVHPRDTHLFAASQSFAAEQETDMAQTVAASTRPTAARSAAVGADFSAQIDQLRNDIFGIAMNVSALSDRLDRLEQRIPTASQSMQAGVATLRAELETWLEKHLNTAVEHCMHQIIQRSNSAPSHPDI